MDEMLDKELHGIMGDMIIDDAPKQMPVIGVRYGDVKVPMHMPVMEQQTRNADNAEDNAEKRVKRVAENCNDCPFTKKRSLLDRLWDMTKWLGICGGICMLLWWFEANGLMVTEAARPCTFASGCIGFFGAGMNFRK